MRILTTERTDMPSLPDLETIRQRASEAVAKVNPSDVVAVSAETLQKIVSVYRDQFGQEDMGVVGNHTLWFQNASRQSYFVSVQEFPLLVALVDLVRALEAYAEKLEELAVAMGFESRTGDGGNLFGKLPSSRFASVLSGSELQKLQDAIQRTIAAEDDRERMRRFLSDPEWSGLADAQGNVGRKLNRSTDWQESAVLKTGRMIAAANAGRLKLIRAMVKAGIGSEDVRVKSPVYAPAQSEAEAARLAGGENILFYGAPGTGKSHDVWQMVGQSPSFATVFHPDMQNSDFGGTLKPGVDANGKVTYAFRPGPFAAAVAEAWKRPAEKVYLVIEELNRAAAAAVFGELFQLLDRGLDGSGRYEVNFPSPEFADWFAAETGMAMTRLALPSNFWILATMNSADQGVFPLDTAFRRRWRQKYLPIDYSKAPDATLHYGTPSGVASIGWRQFVRALNNFLVSSLEVGEDRLVGPRFLDEHDLGEGTVPGKLLIYLWDDLLRHHGRADLFDGGVKTYGELDRRSTSGERIFSDKFLATIGDGASEAGVAGGEARA